MSVENFHGLTSSKIKYSLLHAGYIRSHHELLYFTYTLSLKKNGLFKNIVLRLYHLSTIFPKNVCYKYTKLTTLQCVILHVFMCAGPGTAGLFIIERKIWGCFFLHGFRTISLMSGTHNTCRYSASTKPTFV